MKAQTMRNLRRYHHYIGVFFTPAILLFALSGALQTFRLQEAKGYGGTPPGWIVWMASVHKDQSLPRERAASKPGAGDAAKPAAKGGQQARPPARVSPLPLKIFVALLSIGLILSSVLGVVIALNNRSTRTVSIAMLVAGAVVPLLLLIV